MGEETQQEQPWWENILCRRGGCSGPLLAGFSLSPRLCLSGLAQRKGKGTPRPRLAWHSVRKESQDPFCLENPQEEQHEGEIMPTEHPREEENQGADIVSILRGKS